MCFNDYIRFFYITSICYYEPQWHNNWIQDIQSKHLKLSSAGIDTNYGVLKFTNPIDIDDDCIITFNQINARHVDETMRGSYRYAPVKVVLAKILENPSRKSYDLVLIDGEFFDGNTMLLRFDQLMKGDYVIFYQFDWTRLHPVRKAIFNLYSPNKIELKRVDENQFNPEMKKQMIAFLEKRMKLGLSYKVPKDN